MGAWHVGSFENDSAADWIWKIEDPILKVIESTMRTFLKQPVKSFEVQRRVRVPGTNLKKVSRQFAVRGRRRCLKIETETVTSHGRRHGHAEAEAAAALLDELTPYGWRDRLSVKLKAAPGLKCYTHARRVRSSQRLRRPLVQSVRTHGSCSEGVFLRPNWTPVHHMHLHLKAEERKLYGLADRVLKALVEDEAFIQSWNEPKAKLLVLEKIRASLVKKIEQEKVVAERRKLAPKRRQRKGRST